MSEFRHVYRTERSPLSFLTRSAYVFPDKTAVVHGARQYTYRQLEARVNRLASALASTEIFQSLARRGIAELDVNYRDSPIVDEYHSGLFESIAALGGGPRAGDRAPDADGLQINGTSKRLYELLRSDNHKLLIFSDRQSNADELAHRVSAAQQVNDRYGGHVTVFMILSGSDATRIHGWNGEVIVDASGSLRRAYHAVGSCAYLIRPDGYVADRSFPVEGKHLLEFLSRIFA